MISPDANMFAEGVPSAIITRAWSFTLTERKVKVMPGRSGWQ